MTWYLEMTYEANERGVGFWPDIDWSDDYQEQMVLAGLVEYKIIADRSGYWLTDKGLNELAKLTT